MPLRIVLLLIVSVLAGCRQEPVASAPLADEAFWRLSTQLSEPPKAFSQADNLVSNEALYAEFARLIRRRGGAYVGVGPEQNFSYIARIRPAIAFVVDVRQDNRNLHLMYKALFEVARDRAEFLSRLFSRPRPPALGGDAPVADLFAAFDHVPARQDLFDDTARVVRERLVTTHRFPLSGEDLQAITAALRAFFTDGPDIRYGRSLPPSKTRPSYRALMTMPDLWGNPQSFLANEAAFAFVRTLHTRNLIVPVVGDFAGPHAIRQVGEYLRAQGQTLAAFYASNVEVYLTRTQRRTFCANLETLPHDDGTHFIGNRRLLPLRDKLQACARIQPSLIFPEGFSEARP